MLIMTANNSGMELDLMGGGGAMNLPPPGNASLN